MTMIFIIFVALSATLIEARNIQFHHSSDTELLYFLKDKTLLQVTINDDRHETELVSENVSDYTLDEIRKRLFWINNIGAVFVHYFHVDTQPNNTKQAKFGVPKMKIAYDVVTNKLYSADSFTRRIKAFDLKSHLWSTLSDQYHSYMNTNFEQKQVEFLKILLDSQAGFMFVLAMVDGVKNIYRYNMDGHSEQLLISNVYGEEFEIDISNQKLYWATRDTIESVNYNGTDKRIILEIDNRLVLSFSIDNNQFYLATFSDGSKSTMIIKTFYLQDDGKYKADATRTIELKGLSPPVKNLKVFRKSVANSQLSNPCALDNGGCEQTCLLTPKWPNTRCRCWDMVRIPGWNIQISDDGSRCPKLPPWDFRGKRQIPFDMYHQQPTLRPEPQPTLPDVAYLPVYLYPGK